MLSNVYDYAIANTNGDVPSIYTMEYIRAREKKLVIADKAKKLDKKYLQNGRTYYIGDVVHLDAYDKAPGAEVTLQRPNQSSYSVTVNKNKEVSLVVDVVADKQSRFDKQMQYAREGAYALAKQMDTDVAALYASFSTTDQGTAGSAITKPTILAAQQELVDNEVPIEECYFVFHSANREDLLALASLTYPVNIGNMGSASPVITGDANEKTGLLFDKVFSAPVYLSSNVPVTAGTPTYHNMLFHPEAFIVAEQIGATPIDAKLPLHLNAQLFSIYNLYGVNNLRTDHGVEVKS